MSWTLSLLLASGCSIDEPAPGGSDSDRPIEVPVDLAGAMLVGYVYSTQATVIVPEPNAAPAGSTPLAGAPVRVVNLRGEQVASATTGADGAFAFENMPNGLLSVEVMGPTGSASPVATAEVTAFPEVTIAVNRSYPVTREEASAKIVAAAPADARVVRSLQPVPKGTLVYPSGGKVGSEGPTVGDAFTVPADSWFFYVDLYPSAGFAHPVEYRLVDAASAKVTLVDGLHWPPVLNHGGLWSSGEYLYRFTNFDFDKLSDPSYAPANATAEATSELASEPPPPAEQPLPPELDQFAKHNTDPGSVFLIVWLAAGESYRVPGASRLIDKFVKGGVNYQTNIRWIRWERDPDRSDGKLGLQRYLNALTELNLRIAQRLAAGEHSTLVVYVTSHGGGGTFGSYRDEAHHYTVSPQNLQLTTTGACRVRAFFDFCGARGFADGVKARFDALPAEKRHDYVLYSACGPEEFGYSIPIEWAIGSAFVLEAGTRFQTHVAKWASVSGGDVNGLLDPSGTKIRDEMGWLVGTWDPTTPNRLQHPSALVGPGNPKWCEAQPPGVAVCGNGAIESGEQCEADSDCNSASECVKCKCVLRCGNGKLDPNEQCEADSDCDSTSECVSCQCVPRCGNGKLDPNEQCDGAAQGCGPADECVNCQCLPLCGNNKVDAGEDCDGVGPAQCTTTGHECYKCKCLPFVQCAGLPIQSQCLACCEAVATSSTELALCTSTHCP